MASLCDSVCLRFRGGYYDGERFRAYYDPGATKINQENRIKLMLANAKALKKEQELQSQTPVPCEVP